MSVVYNERSWAIDLISYLSQRIQEKQLGIRRIGGEHTVQDTEGPLFPDVLLFGDRAGQTILQGWELKMPDTSITNSKLIENACEKARRLRVNSFVVWNVNQAVLYVADDDLEGYAPQQTWRLAGSPIKKRSNVAQRESDWKQLADRILRDVGRLFQRGVLQDRTLIETFSDDALIEALFSNASATADQLQEVMRRDNQFRSRVELWWANVQPEYATRNQVDVLAHRALAGWVAKIIFLHVLKSNCATAYAVNDFHSETEVQDAFNLLRQVTESCNFAQVFSKHLGEEQIPQRTWRRLLELNDFFATVDIEAVGAKASQALLHSTVSVAQRKAAGQFTTPSSLARFLVRVAVRDQTKLIFDPCCGTGTIAAAAYNEKRSLGESSSNARATVWASDKFAFPLQAATLALADPEHMGNVLHIFQSDVLDLRPAKPITFHDPHTGSEIEKPLPAAHCVVSNLPFVQFEEVETSSSTIKRINERIAAETNEKVQLPRRSDLYAYLPFHIWTLLENEGRAGLILSNAWLGTDWGQAFRDALRMFFHVEKVIVSGEGRWFQNADVVTSILVLRKRNPIQSPDDGEKTAFITIKKDISELTNQEARRVASYATLDRAEDNWTDVETYSTSEIHNLKQTGVEWTALFADVEWLASVHKKMVAASDIFDIGRGERRGWNALFYPSDEHDIEDQYLKPGLKQPAKAKGLIAEPDIEVFSCTRSIEELKQLNHSGALSWIQRFRHETNTKGTPLPDVLARSGLHWYEMKATRMADLVLPVNPFKRLFIPKLREPSFVDQRFTRFSLTDANVSTNLCHALMNSVVGLFLIEALGFGRGLGALDLSTTRTKRQLHLLDPRRLNKAQKRRIREAFRPLKQRAVHPLPKELEQKDRKIFDATVLEVFNISDHAQEIRNALMRLYSIRMAVETSR